MVEIDTDEVRRVGRNLYPTLADKYAAAAALIAELGGGSSEWGAYRDQIGLYLTTSESHLRHCGEVLVTLADDYDATEEENVHNITFPYESSYRNESP